MMCLGITLTNMKRSGLSFSGILFKAAILCGTLVIPAFLNIPKTFSNYGAVDYYLLIAMTYANVVGILSWGADGVTDPKSGNMVAFTYTGVFFPVDIPSCLHLVPLCL